MVMALIEKVQHYMDYADMRKRIPKEIMGIGEGLRSLMASEVQRFSDERPMRVLMQYWFTGKPIDEENQCDYLQNYLATVDREAKPEGSHTLINLVGVDYAIIWENR